MANITGIIINIIMLIIVILIALYGVMLNRGLNICETKQSPFCYTIHCPCDVAGQNEQTVPPCMGYAKLPAGPNRWYCSNAPLTLVDDNGNIVF